VVVRAAAVLRSRRVAAFCAAAAGVVAWYVVAPHLPHVRLWIAIAIVSAAVIPGTLLLVLLALPLWRYRSMLVAAGGCALAAFLFSEAGWGLPENFAKLAAATFAGWAFLGMFEQLWWVTLVAFVVPFVDIVSVWRGPTHAVTTHHFHIYTTVSIAFLAPGGGAAYLGPPDVLFYALFLAAAARWQLRVVRTWICTTAMYGLTVVVAYAADVGGLPALPFLSAGFLLANGDLLWGSIRPSADSSAAS
jgi:hypothetical protein